MCSLLLIASACGNAEKDNSDETSPSNVDNVARTVTTADNMKNIPKNSVTPSQTTTTTDTTSLQALYPEEESRNILEDIDIIEETESDLFAELLESGVFSCEDIFMAIKENVEENPSPASGVGRGEDMVSYVMDGNRCVVDVSFVMCEEGDVCPINIMCEAVKRGMAQVSEDDGSFIDVSVDIEGDNRCSMSMSFTISDNISESKDAVTNTDISSASPDIFSRLSADNLNCEDFSEIYRAAKQSSEKFLSAKEYESFLNGCSASFTVNLCDETDFCANTNIDSACSNYQKFLSEKYGSDNLKFLAASESETECHLVVHLASGTVSSEEQQSISDEEQCREIYDSIVATETLLVDLLGYEIYDWENSLDGKECRTNYVLDMSETCGSSECGTSESECRDLEITANRNVQELIEHDPFVIESIGGYRCQISVLYIIP